MFIEKGLCDPQTIQTIVITLGCLPELDSKTLLLKTSYTLVTGLGEVKLVLLWKPPP